MIVRSLKYQNAVVLSLAPRQIDRGDVRWQLLGKRRSREVPKLLWSEERTLWLLFSWLQYNINIPYLSIHKKFYLSIFSFKL